MKRFGIIVLWITSLSIAGAADPIPIWPDLAPGETTKKQGTALPQKATENPPVTRIQGITRPTLHAYLPEGGGNGSAVVVLPGGGYSYVVADKEGSETAKFLNPLGISVFVLHYRTKREGETERWKRPLQDSQRAIRFLRANAAKWKLDPKEIGLLAFSAGGQTAAIHIGECGEAYEKVDAVDEQSERPDFAMLVYPWNVGDNSTGELMPEIKIGKTSPPTFLVHTDDDRSSALGSAAIYMELKKAKVPAELHVYQNGGHGYGMREVRGSAVATWSDRAADWLRVRGFGNPSDREKGRGLEIPKWGKRLAAGKALRVRTDIKAIDTALTLYRVHGQTYPSTDQGISALVNKPINGRIPKQWKQTMAAEPLDPWGNSYGYRYPPLKNKGKPDVYSKGPDGEAGTDDDVGNWKD